MPFQWMEGTTNPGQDEGLSNGSWMRMGGRFDDPNENLEFSVDGGRLQEVQYGDDLMWDWDGPILENGTHTIEVTRTDASGDTETTEWEITVDEDDQGREADRQRQQAWRQGGRQEFFDSRGVRQQGPLTGGGGGGGAGQLVTAGVGGAAAITGTAEKGNAQPQVEKGNAT